MKYVCKGSQIVIDKGLTDDSDLFSRLLSELAKQGYEPVSRQGRNRVLLPKLTLKFASTDEAQRAEKWIESVFEA